jgi:type IX secretion system PorP/SprF family membrane protein
MGTPVAQYSGNQIIFNPGYAGIYDVFSANISVRKLWVGLPGSPSLISLNGHAPFRGMRNALGFVYQHEAWGPMAGNFGYINYAHKVFLRNSLISLGLQTGFFNNMVNWNKIDHVMHDEDPGLGEGRTSTTVFDLNLGIYFQSRKMYLGFSAKHLTQPKFGHMTNYLTHEDWYSQKRMNFFFIGGYNIELPVGFWDLRPEMLIRYVYTEPTTFKFGMSAVWQGSYSIGTAFHSAQRTISLSVKGEVAHGVNVGYSYDLHFGALRSFQRGSHEISISYHMPLFLRHDTATRTLWL